MTARGAARPGRRARTAGPAGDPAALSDDDRRLVIDTFIELLDGLYTHLPLKRARYSIDPLQRLRLLRQRVDDRVDEITEAELHAELAAIMTSLRDAHTRYIGPTTLEGRVMTLPFLVEGYQQDDRRRYIVSKVAKHAQRIHDPQFVAGVELLDWNAVPIDRAVDLYSERETGGRPDARRSRALESLTIRALQYGPPPDEQWVVIGYRDAHRKRREIRVDWREHIPGRARTAVSGDAGRRVMAVDPAAEMGRRVKKLLFARDLWMADQLPRSSPRKARRREGDWLETDFQDVVAARPVPHRGGPFGYLRLWSFDVADDDAFLADVVRLLRALPRRGLIIDLRGNPGGSVRAAERLMQLFTPRRVTTTGFSMVATALTRAMGSAPQNDPELTPWRSSLDQAVATGDVYSHAVALTPSDLANDIGQVYGGPVVAVVDANTYSAGDLFAAGFVDNDIGTLVCTDAATGGGGANVWDPDDVRDMLLGTAFEPKPLPGGIRYTVAARRATRSVTSSGSAIEDVGVAGQLHYPMTKRDLTGDNVGLHAFCIDLLRGQDRGDLQVERPGAAELLVTTRGLDRLDVILDGRPKDSLDVDDRRPLRVPFPEAAGVVELCGYRNNELVQRRVVPASI